MRYYLEDLIRMCVGFCGSGGKQEDAKSRRPDIRISADYAIKSINS